MKVQGGESRRSGGDGYHAVLLLLALGAPGQLRLRCLHRGECDVCGRRYISVGDWWRGSAKGTLANELAAVVIDGYDGGD